VINIKREKERIIQGRKDGESRYGNEYDQSILYACI
jgi:hypothetical protein